MLFKEKDRDCSILHKGGANKAGPFEYTSGCGLVKKLQFSASSNIYCLLRHTPFYSSRPVIARYQHFFSFFLFYVFNFLFPFFSRKNKCADSGRYSAYYVRYLCSAFIVLWIFHGYIKGKNMTTPLWKKPSLYCICFRSLIHLKISSIWWYFNEI